MAWMLVKILPGGEQVSMSVAYDTRNEPERIKTILGPYLTGGLSGTIYEIIEIVGLTENAD